MRRRDFITCATTSIATASLLRPFSFMELAAQDVPPKKILYFSRSQGFEHSPVKSLDGGKSVSDRVLSKICADLGYELVCSKDGTIFDGDLTQYKAFIFYTSRDLDKEGGDGAQPMSEQGRQNFLRAIREGAGFLGFHSSTDTWIGETGYKVDPWYDQSEYIRMQGGEFIGHGEIQEAIVEVVDTVLPSLEKREPSFKLTEEWYSNKNFAPDMRVLASVQTAGMKKEGVNKCYDRPAFPCIWTRKEGNGAAVYCAFGHNDSFWTSGDWDDLLSDLIKVSLGTIEVSTQPNLKQSCPGADQLQNDWTTSLLNTSD